MMAESSKLVAGETMGKADRETEVRAAIERIFEGGCPQSLIILADTGRDVRVQVVGPIVELRALSLTGMAQCIHMLDSATAPRPAKLDS